MKKLICMLLACVMLLSCALAAPRFPQKGGSAVDNAAVLSQQTVEDVKKLHELVKKETKIELHLVTVDFLDGESIDKYAEGLMHAWDLDDDAMLLLLAVGEDKFTAWAGKDVKVSSAVRQKVMASALSVPFLAQEYDEAVRSLMPALVTEINKAYGTRIDLNGLFGVQNTAPTVDWLQRALEETEERSRRMQENMERRIQREQDEDDGISLGKIILTFIFLSMIFGKKGRRGGCGCAPFAGLFGLWKLWDRD